MGNNGRQGWKAPRGICPVCGRDVAVSARDYGPGHSIRPHNNLDTGQPCTGIWEQREKSR